MGRAGAGDVSANKDARRDVSGRWRDHCPPRRRGGGSGCDPTMLGGGRGGSITRRLRSRPYGAAAVAGVLWAHGSCAIIAIVRGEAIDVLLAYYGDDFTGSTDVLEALVRGGVETVLFVETPTSGQLASYPHVRAVGVAGTGRAMLPAEMDTALPDTFAALGRPKPKFGHYKVCSTFDSSPQIGSIGLAIDIGCRVFLNRFVPLVVGAPVLQRFCVFGNLFARSGLDSPAYRLDRHPTMRAHPVTPMSEADLRMHLSEQTKRPIGLVDVLALDAGYEAAAVELERQVRAPGSVVLFDALTVSHLATVGRLIAEEQKRQGKPLFVAGSSGIEYALAMQFKSPAREHIVTEPMDRVAVVSGSCSPVTGRQIAWAVEHGFAEMRIDATSLVRIRTAVDAGRSVVIHSHGCQVADKSQLGTLLGQILKDVLRGSGIRRVAL